MRIEENENSSFSTETGSLKFGSGSPLMIADEECWNVPNMGIYDGQGKYLGETVQEAEQTLIKRKNEAD